MFNAIFQRPGSPNGRGANTAINPASLALLSWLAADYDDQQRHYVDLRRWYDGDHRVPLTDRQQEYLAVANFPWSINYLRLPVELCVERMEVIGFDGPDGIGGDDGLLDEWWTTNRMDAIQSQVHRAAAVDGDTYVLVEWDADNGRPVFSHERAYDGQEGMKVHYLSNQRRVMTMASKVWTETTFDDRGQIVTTRRLNLYLPDRVERYAEKGRGWQPFEEPGFPWPIPNPIGRIPVVHFRWRDDLGLNWGESELEPLVPLQMALNKAVIDLLEAADKTGAANLTLTGALWPATAPVIRAGDVLSVSAADAHWGSIPPGDLGQLREVGNDFIIRMAQLSHIPLQYFQVTGQIASAATQAADDGQLVAKVRSLAVALGNAWEDALYVGLKLNEAYGDGRDLARGQNIETRWADFERVDRLAIEERRAAIVESLTRAGLGVEGVVSLAALGYSEEEQRRLLQVDVVNGVTQ